MVTVEQRTNDGIPILDVTGRLSAGEAADYLVSRVRAAIEGGGNRIVINLSGVGYIDSLGLEALLQIHNLLRGRKGEVKLLNPTDKVAELLQMTRLTTVFDIGTDESTAVAALKETG